MKTGGSDVCPPSEGKLQSATYIRTAPLRGLSQTQEVAFEQNKAGLNLNCSGSSPSSSSEHKHPSNRGAASIGHAATLPGGSSSGSSLNENRVLNGIETSSLIQDAIPTPWNKPLVGSEAWPLIDGFDGTPSDTSTDEPSSDEYFSAAETAKENSGPTGSVTKPLGVGPKPRTGDSIPADRSSPIPQMGSAPHGGKKG